MTTRATVASRQKGRDRIAMALLLLCALGALFSFFGSIGVVADAGPETRVVESWRMYGFLVFAGLFVLLAIRPRHYPGVWELVIFHKVAVAVTTATFIGDGATDAVTTAAADGILAALILTAYLLSKGYAGWMTPGASREETA